MLNESSMPTAEATAAERERARRDALCPTERVDAISYDWARVGFGIVMAGGAYPLVLAAIFLSVGTSAIAWGVFTGNPYRSELAESITLLFSFGLNALFFGTIGILWSGLVTALTLPVVYLFVWSLNAWTSIVRIGAFAGGLVGFICVLPLTLSLPSFDLGNDLGTIVLIVLLGPMLTTILGQLGGAWGGSKSREIGPAPDWQKYFLGAAIGKPPAVSPADTQSAAQPRFQFRIRDLLWISVWLSLLLTLIRLSRIPCELMLPLLGGWLVFQWFTLWIGGRLVRRLGPWWARRRQSRST